MIVGLYMKGRNSYKLLTVYVELSVSLFQLIIILHACCLAENRLFKGAALTDLLQLVFVDLKAPLAVGEHTYVVFYVSGAFHSDQI